MIYQVNDVLITKKKHVCGSDQWLVLRIGAEIKIRCIKCQREVLIFKADLDKKVKGLNKHNS
jgi:hypothetical protein